MTEVSSQHRIVVLASGRGSNLAALMNAQNAGLLQAPIVAVGSDKPTAPALSLAARASIPTFVVPPKSFASREAWDEALRSEVAAHKPSLIVLAGFMRIVGAPLVAKFAGRIVNVHPSLLPAFPGLDGPGQALAAGVRISGCTVHLVDTGVDTGRILGQAAVPVRPSDTVDALHERIQQQEHKLLPLVVDRFLNGDLPATIEKTSPNVSLSVPSLAADAR